MMTNLKLDGGFKERDSQREPTKIILITGAVGKELWSRDQTEDARLEVGGPPYRQFQPSE